MRISIEGELRYLIMEGVVVHLNGAVTVVLGHSLLMVYG